MIEKMYNRITKHTIFQPLTLKMAFRCGADIESGSQKKIYVNREHAKKKEKKRKMNRKRRSLPLVTFGSVTFTPIYRPLMLPYGLH